MSGQHARLSPSGAHRWMACAGSLVLEDGLPDSTSIHAAEGTAAHELGAMCLTEGKDANAYLGRVLKADGYEFTVDENMADYIQEYVNRIREYANGNAELMVEQRVDFSRYVGIPDQFGTSDAVVLLQDELQVHDLKYGRGVQVDADNNKQLLLYALGTYDMASLLGDFKKVRLVIHQPRINGHLSEWDLSVDELLAFSVEALEAAQRTRDARDHVEVHGMSPAFNKYLNPGESQCRWCKAKARCPALMHEVLQTVDNDFEDLSQLEDLTPTEPAAMTNEHLGILIPKLTLIRDWCDAVHTLAFNELDAGNDVPGCKLVQSRRGNRSWTDASEVEKTMKSMRLKKEEMYNSKIISPTQAEKLVGSTPKRWTRLASLITQPKGKPTLVLASDKREPITPAIDDFADLNDVPNDVPLEAEDLI